MFEKNNFKLTKKKITSYNKIFIKNGRFQVNFRAYIFIDFFSKLVSKMLINR